jgi:Resolvase, N terminal domain.
MKGAAHYARVSSVKQQLNENIASQIAAIEEYARQNDFQIIPQHVCKAAQAPKELRRFPPYCGLTVGREDRAMTRAIKLEPIRNPARSPATPRSVRYELTQPKNRCH